MAHIVVFLLATTACAHEQTLPANTHEFRWEATSKDGLHFHGESVSTTIDGAYSFSVRQLSRLCAAGDIPEETDFEIAIEWKGKEFKRVRTIRSRPKVLSRGPDKEREAPRGPHAYDGAKETRR